MLKRLLVYGLLLVTFGAKGQVNLVPNPSFEDYTQCPNTNGQIQLATGWYTPTTGSPDYFNTCASNLDFSTPLNLFGAQTAYDGTSYCGIQAYFSLASKYREYIQCKLIDTLKKDKLYCIEFFVSLAGRVSQYSINNLGAVCSNNPISDNSLLGAVLNYSTILNSSSNIQDTLNWVKISGVFYASGGESYLTIGNFYNNEQTDTIKLNNNAEEISYYYIDNISIVECDTILPLNIGNIITPNNDGLNDNFTIQLLPPNSQLTIYNRWGNQVYTSTNYQNNWDGANCADGVYYYILTLPSGNTTKGTITILRG